MKNKKSKKDKEKQKKNETLKKIPQNHKDSQEKMINKITYHCCIHQHGLDCSQTGGPQAWQGPR